jgi:hypothetical protein
MKKYIASDIDVEREAAYRSGYYDGFWAALRTFDGAMDAGFTRDISFEYCAEFWKTELWEWVKSELGSNSLAPEIVTE